jgi:DNA modification methylase
VSGVEIEREWAEQHPRTTLGNALHLPWPDGYFDALVTSPGYGNRLADKLLRDRHKRKTYASELARELHPDNGGALPWGPRYKAFHLAAWTEARRVLEPGGLFVLNIKDHIRRGVVQPVTNWHIEALEGLGFRLLEHVHIDCPGMRFGQNRDARVDYESVILFQHDSACGAQSRNQVPRPG